MEMHFLLVLLTNNHPPQKSNCNVSLFDVIVMTKFICRSSSSLLPLCLFILLLLASNINPNLEPSHCLNVSYANIRSIDNKYPTILKFISDNNNDHNYGHYRIGLGSNVTPSMLACVGSPHQVIKGSHSHVRLVMGRPGVFHQKQTGCFRSSYRDLYHLSQISSLKYP